MAGGSMEEVQPLLDKLKEFSPGGLFTDADKAKDVIVDVSELLSTDLSSVQYELFISLCLSDGGLLRFCRQSVKDQAFADAKKSALEVVKILLEKDAAKVAKYMEEVVAVPLLLYRVDKTAKVRCSALELFCLALQRFHWDAESCMFNVAQLVDTLCLGINASKLSSVVYNELRTLGMLAYALPEQSRPHAIFILKVLRSQFDKHTGSRPDLAILAGSLRGLSLYLHHYPEGEHDMPELYTHMYEKLHRTLNPDLNLPKRDAQRAGLELLQHHGAKFSACLLQHHSSLFPWLLRWCQSSNRDDSRAGRGAMGTFLVVVATEIELSDTDQAKKAFKYLLSQYLSLLEETSSSHSVAVAVRGCGLLAGACKLLLPPQQLNALLTTVLTASQHAFYQSFELLDTKLDNLPTYIQSLATIVKHITALECSSVTSVLELSSALVQHYPDLGVAKQHQAHAALMALMEAGGTGAMTRVRNMWMNQALLFTCSHVPPTEIDVDSTSSNGGEDGGGGGVQQWRGVADQVVTYKSFLPMWKALLSPESASKIKVPGLPVSRLTKVSAELFTEFLACVSALIDRLDLSTTRQAQDKSATPERVSSSPSFCNPVADLVANTPKDFQVYHNLVALTSDVLLYCSPHVNTHDDDDDLDEGEDDQHIGSCTMDPSPAVLLVQYLVPRVSSQPLVAPHYALMAALLQYLHAVGYFRDLHSPAAATLTSLVCSVCHDCSSRCSQYSDHLLAACLLLLLRLPAPVMRSCVTDLVQPLQVALTMGLSYPPLGLAAVTCLQRLASDLALTTDADYRLQLRQHLSSVMPKLLPYLTSKQCDGSELQSRVIRVKMSLLNQHRRVDTRKLRESRRDAQFTALRRIQSRVVRLLGGLDADLCRRVGAATPDEVARVAVRWDKLDHVPFKAPYQTATLDLFLDGLVPRVVDLALHSSERQTKVAASELLHAVVIILIGSGRTTPQHPAAPLYRRLFSACLRLACDPDHVSRQLFVTLALQTTHHCTRNRGYEQPDTAALLQAIMEGLESPDSPALRDMSARCLLEFLVWSRKQNTGTSSSGDLQAGASPPPPHPNVKSVLKRVVNLLRHPSAYKRIGGCLAINVIYPELRECPAVVDAWLLELLAGLTTCLTLADQDDPCLRTTDQAEEALAHLHRVMLHYKELFNKPSATRRVPEALMSTPSPTTSTSTTSSSPHSATAGTLAHTLLWLLWRVGHPAVPLRHAAASTVTKLALCVNGCENLRDFFKQYVIVPERLEDFIVQALENSTSGGGGDAGSGGRAFTDVSNVDSSKGAVTHQNLKMFCKYLLGSLDGYAWLLGQRLVPASDLFIADRGSVTLAAVGFFVNSVATCADLSFHPSGSVVITKSDFSDVSATGCSSGKDAKKEPQRRDFQVGRQVTPSEKDALMHLKCTLIIRLLDFVRVMLNDCEASVLIMQKNSILCEKLYEILVGCVLEPSSLGFNIRDTEVASNLLPQMREIFQALRRSLPLELHRNVVSVIERNMTRDDRQVSVLLPDDSSSSWAQPVSPATQNFLRGVRLLHGTGWLKNCDARVVGTLSRELLAWGGDVLLGAASGKDGVPGTWKHRWTSSAAQQLADDVLQIALEIEPHLASELVDRITTTTTTTITSSAAAPGVSCIRESVASLLLRQWCGGCVQHCAGLARSKDGHATAVALLGALAHAMITDTNVRKKYSREFLQSIITFWPSLSSGTAEQVGTDHTLASSSRSYISSELVSLLSLLFLVDSHFVMREHCNNSGSDGSSGSTATVLDFWLHLVSTPDTELRLKLPTLKLLPFFCSMNDAVQRKVVESLEAFRVHHLPLRSNEFPAGSSRDRDLQRTLTEILTAVELTASLPLVEFVARLFCSEANHRYEPLLQSSIARVQSPLSTQAQLSLLQHVHGVALQQTSPSQQSFRGHLTKRLLLPLMQSADAVCLEKFFVAQVCTVMDDLTKPVPMRAEEQLCNLQSKIDGFMMLQILYAKLSRTYVFSPASGVNAAFRPGDTTGKELTKQALLRTVRIAKGELRHDKTHQELRRECACAAYNALVAIVVNVQDDIKFYNNFLFSENRSKGEALWETIVDTGKRFEFDVEVNFKSGSKNRFVAVRKAAKGNMDEDSLGDRLDSSGSPTVWMFASNYLSDSSLREDLSQYDYSNAVVLAVGEKRSNKSQSSDSSGDNGGLVELNLDSSDFNEHEVMAPLTAAILHMKEHNISPAPDTTPPTSLPGWLSSIVAQLTEPATPRNVKLFLLRLLTNVAKVVAPYAGQVVEAVLRCVAEGHVGTGINYFLADMVVMLVGWGEAGIPHALAIRPTLDKVIALLVDGIPQKRADIFKYNVQLFRTLVSVWRRVVRVSGSQVAALIETKGDRRETESGLHVAACMLVSGLPACDESSDREVATLQRAVLQAMVKSHGATVYNAAAEVAGMMLRRMSGDGGTEGIADDTLMEVDEGHSSGSSGSQTACEAGGLTSVAGKKFCDAVVCGVAELMQRYQAQALSCLYHVHKHFPAIASRFASKLLVLLPKLYGLQKCRAFECLVQYLATLPDCYKHLCHHRISNAITIKEPATQLVLLQLLEASLPIFTPEQTSQFMPSLLPFVYHQAPSCRQVLYTCLTALHQRFRNAKDNFSVGIYDAARDVLLRAVADQDTELRNTILEYWTKPASVLPPRDLLLYVLRDLHSSGAEATFLHTACHVLLHVTRSSPSYTRPIFDQPLTQCKFFEMRVSPAWQARHASMVPLFTSTQGGSTQGDGPTLPQLVALTQGGEEGRASAAVLATQDKQFSPTQTVPVDLLDDTFNIGEESTFKEEMSLVERQEKASKAISQGSAGLVFSTLSSFSNRKGPHKRTGLGKTSMNPISKSEESRPPSSAISSTLFRRRFVQQQDREKQSMHFARIEEKRRLERQRLQMERKQRKEAQVTMLREYRVGELPDIQIPHRAVIDPLEALAQRDVIIARHVLVMMADGVTSDTERQLLGHQLTDWSSEYRSVLCTIIDSSVQCPPQLMNAALQMLLRGKMSFDCESITAACISSGQEALGILLLERQILEVQKKLQQKQQQQQPQRKRQKVSVAQSENSQPSDEELCKLQIHLAELYGSIGMWDCVRGVLHCGLSSLLSTTHEALHAESVNHHMRAYELYLSALADPDTRQQSAEEQRIWEERVCSAASNLGQWSELETFVTQRFLTEPASGTVDLSLVFDQIRPSSAVLPALVNSKLMNLLNGADSDGGLVEFVGRALQDEQKKLLLEDQLSVQLAVLSVHQEKPEKARAFLETATNKFLEALSHHSLISPEPMSASLRNVQLILELEDFLNLEQKNAAKEREASVMRLCKRWMNNLPSTKDDSFLAQSIVLYRDLYLHFIGKTLENDDLVNLVTKTRACSHMAVSELAFDRKNPHLASQHLRKLEAMLVEGSLDKETVVKYYFLRTKANIIRGQQKEAPARLKSLIEAWCKYMGKVNMLVESSSNSAIEVEYLSLESRICVELCETIAALGNNYDASDRHFQVLAAKFSGVSAKENKESWYGSLLQCSYNDLSNASVLCDNSTGQVKKLPTPEESAKTYDALAKFCEDSMSKWSSHVDLKKYQETFVTATLKAMAKGSSDAHYNFPRIIHVLNDTPNLLPTFQKGIESVPIWMFLLWLPHILIYVDKNPSLALQPLVLKLAEEYPQAMFYPFSVSKIGFKLGGKLGQSIQAMCSKVEDIMDIKCHLHQPLLEALSIVKEPFGDIKVDLKNVPKTSTLEMRNTLLRVHDQMFKSSSSFAGVISSMSDRSLIGTGNELGAQYQAIYQKAKDVFSKHFGPAANKIKTAKQHDLNKGIDELLAVWKNSIRDIKNISPWLATFQASNHTDIIEIPGQYTGFSKPLVQYHTQISNFSHDLHVMKSLRSPIVITMLGDDERTYKFLVKTGEDLRTDQRMELMFTLMNRIYSVSSLTRQLSVEPNLTTFTVVPLSVDVGILQWVDSTETLKTFIETTVKEEEKRAIIAAFDKYSRLDLKKLLRMKKEECVRGFADNVNSVPWDLLRRALIDLSSSSESFFHLRTNLCGSHAALSISQWLMGVGDRHLGNFLVEFKTAKIVGIDFGHHFETAVQFLKHPELLPFRMSPQFVNLAKPLGTNGIIRETMVACLEALVQSKRVVLAAVEAFVKEPTQDWIKFVRREQGAATDQQIELYSADRMKLIEEKLAGINPCCIIEWAMTKNNNLDSEVKEFLTNVTFGEGQPRSSLSRQGLTVSQQVDALLDLATDPNVLGRTYPGWSPFDVPIS